MFAVAELVEVLVDWFGLRDHQQFLLCYYYNAQPHSSYCIFLQLTMGLTESKKLPAEEEEVAHIHHERFANRVILKNDKEDDQIMIKVALPSEKEYNVWREELGKLGEQEVLLLPKRHSFHRQGFCGSTGYVELIYENYPFILSDEIHNRQCLSTKYFEQNELWYLGYTLLSAAQDFHRRGKKLGDIRPMNIFISQDGSVKLACLYSWPLERTNYEKSFDKEVSYIAPEEVIDLGYGKTESSADFQLCETFSIGLTLLDAAILSDSSDLYRNSKQLDYEGLEARLAELDNRSYSNPLVQLIRNMCEVNPQSRTKAKDLFQWLRPFQESINNFAEFQADALPAKFSNKASTLPNQSQYSNIYNPKPYTSAYNPNPYIQSNPPNPNAAYYTATPVSSNPSEISKPTPSSYQIPLPPLPVYPMPSLQTGILQSSYVPFKSNFSLSKIDEQLQQSRKLFPS